jgi:hypothetical protein
MEQIMDGFKVKTGAPKRNLFSRVYRITLHVADADLLPFFEQLGQLPPDRRNAALLAAIRDGAAAGQQEMSRAESRQVSIALDTLANVFDFE